MAEEQAAVQDNAAGAGPDQPFQYSIKIEEAGPATKKVSVEIPPDRIASKMSEQFKELRQQAAIPGFRLGHAPAKLIEKRFQNDVKEQVRRSLIAESYQQAVEKNSLQVIGEPQFDNPDEMQLPETGALTYSFQVEVQPEFELPPLQGLKVRKPRVQVLEKHVDQAVENLREQQGTLIPVEDRGVEAGDQIIADVHVDFEGEVVGHGHDSKILVKAGGRLAGIVIDDLDKQLAGLKQDKKRAITTTAPENFPEPKARGKEVKIEVALKEIKKLELAEIDQAFLDNIGFAKEADLREALKAQMLERLGYDVQQSMREQVNNYLLSEVKMELPLTLSTRQEERVVRRREIDLLLRGVPREQVDSASEALRGGAKDEAIRELKLFFILQKVANVMKVDVDEGELNHRVAMMARQDAQRPEKLKQEMAKDGRLLNLYVQMREQKAVDKILLSAIIEEFDLEEPEKK